MGFSPSHTYKAHHFHPTCEQFLNLPEPAAVFIFSRFRHTAVRPSSSARKTMYMFFTGMLLPSYPSGFWTTTNTLSYRVPRACPHDHACITNWVPGETSDFRARSTHSARTARADRCSCFCVCLKRSLPANRNKNTNYEGVPENISVLTFPVPLRECLPYNILPRSRWALEAKAPLPTPEAPETKTLKSLLSKLNLPLRKHGPHEAGEGRWRGERITCLVCLESNSLFVTSLLLPRNGQRTSLVPRVPN